MRIRKKTKDDKLWTYTKWLITIIVFFAILWISWSYVLASYAALHGVYTVVESLSKTVCTVVISGVLGYLLKSFFETFCDRHNQLVKEGHATFHSPFLKNADPDSDDTVYYSTNTQEYDSENIKQNENEESVEIENNIIEYSDDTQIEIDDVEAIPESEADEVYEDDEIVG